MTEFKDIMYSIGDVSHDVFEIFALLDNYPNYFYGVLMISGIIYWLNWQRKMSAEARKNGTLE